MNGADIDVKFKGKKLGSSTGQRELDYITGDLVRELSTGRAFIVDLDYFDDTTLLKDVMVEIEPESVELLMYNTTDRVQLYIGGKYKGLMPDNRFV